MSEHNNNYPTIEHKYKINKDPFILGCSFIKTLQAIVGARVTTSMLPLPQSEILVSWLGTCLYIMLE